MSNNFDVDEYFNTMKTISCIAIEKEWEDMIKSHLTTAEKMANIIENAPIDINSLELSNCFNPGKA